MSVSNVGKTVYLDGSVASYRARLEAEDVAWGAPGVEEVVDRIVVAVQRAPWHPARPRAAT